MHQRTLLIALAVAVLVAAAGIVVVLRPGEAGAQRQQQGFVVSFAAAESALGDDAAERREQIRDWARFGLAARLDVDTGGMRDAFFDAFPIRDNGFGENAQSTNDFRQQNGYVTNTISSEPELNEFTSTAKRLSTLEIRDGEVHAGGWNWQGPDVTAQDITVLRRACSRHEQPGFNSAAPSSSPATPNGPAARILLICPENDDARGCGD